MKTQDKTQLKTKRLPNFFNSDFLYSNLQNKKDPLYKTYLEEADTLIKFMKNAYKMDLKINKNGILEFPSTERYLKGEEYGFMLRYYKFYSA